MALAGDAFQCCRLGDGSLLAGTRRVLEEVEGQGSLLVEIPQAELGLAAPNLRKGLGGPVAAVEQPALDEFTPARLWLLQFVWTAAVELERLWLAGAMEPMQSLGYAVHNLPAMVASPSDGFNGDHFEFSFRVAAYHWSEYSPDMRAALAQAVDLSPRRADDWVETDGFAINLAPTGPRGSLGWDDVGLCEGVDLKARRSWRDRAPVAWFRRRGTRG